MANKYKLDALVLLCIILAFGGCSVQPSGPEVAEGDGSLQFKLTFADYANHALPNVLGISGARVLDPSTQVLRITVTGSDIATPIVKNVVRGSDATGYDACFTDYEAGNSNGYIRQTSFILKDLPTGLDRTVLVEAIDEDGTTICRGLGTTKIHLNRSNWVGIALNPVVYTAIGIDETVKNATVPAGKAVYYRIELDGSSPWCLVNLKSASDVDLYVATPSNQWYWSWFQASQAVDEGVLIRNTDSTYWTEGNNAWFIAAYNPGDTDAIFTLSAASQEARAFDYSTAYEEPGAYDSVADDTDGTLAEWDPYPNWQSQYTVDLGFDFVYNGRSYSKLYVSPNGYLSFWKFAFWYDWWYWQSTAWWSGSYYSGIPSDPGAYYGYYYDNAYYWWPLGEGEYLPNELISLGRRPYFYASAAHASERPSKILVKKGTATIGGKTLNRVTIEYQNMYAWYDGTDAANRRYLSGQIVLTENQFDASYDGSISLRYDRSNSNLYGVGSLFVGLENNVGDEFMPEYSDPADSSSGGYWNYWSDDTEKLTSLNFWDADINLPRWDVTFSSNHGGIIAVGE